MDIYDVYAEYYDLDTDVAEDIPFYLGYAELTGSPILDLACGTGRITLQLARAGFEVTGLDSSQNMLEYAKSKASDEGLSNITWLNASMTDFILPDNHFNLVIIALRSFMHLHTVEDQLACLKRIKQCLKPEGILLMDLYAPNSFILGTTNLGKTAHRSYLKPDGSIIRRSSEITSRDLINQLLHITIHFEKINPAGECVSITDIPLVIRFIFRFELQHLLERAGLNLDALYNDYDKNEYDGWAEMIVSARKPLRIRR